MIYIVQTYYCDEIGWDAEPHLYPPTEEYGVALARYEEALDAELCDVRLISRNGNGEIVVLKKSEAWEHAHR